MPFKIVHIHTDLKFIDESVIFEGPDFDNEIIVLGEKGQYTGRYQESTIYQNPSRSNIDQLITHCRNADMVVLYNLCFVKSFIANRLPAQVKIAWRFFGHELYRYDISEQYSDLTKSMLAADKFNLIDGLKNLKNYIPALRNLRNLIAFRAVYDDEFRKAIKRVDFFLWHFQEEYEYLRKGWPDLPSFCILPTLNLPTLKYDSNHNGHKEKENLIVIGNSKNSLNNHFDILNMVLESRNFNQYVFHVPFSYDSETSYSRKFREAVSGLENIILSEAFLSLDDYEAVFKKAAALVINTYRQKALGTILLALKNGVKVYLNRKNITLSVLSSCGFVVYPVDQLFDDLKNDNIHMRSEEVTHNAVVMDKLRQENSIALFQQRIHDEINKV